MKTEISPKPVPVPEPERTVTLTMTETEARNFRTAIFECYSSGRFGQALTDILDKVWMLTNKVVRAAEDPPGVGVNNRKLTAS